MIFDTRRSTSSKVPRHRAKSQPPVSTLDGPVRVTGYDDAVLSFRRESQVAAHSNTLKHSGPSGYDTAYGMFRNQSHLGPASTGYDTAYLSFRKDSQATMRHRDSHETIILKNSDPHLEGLESESNLKRHHDSHQHMKPKSSQANMRKQESARTIKKQESNSNIRKNESSSLFWTQSSQSNLKIHHKQKDSHSKIKSRDSHHRSGGARHRESWTKLKQRESVLHHFHASSKFGQNKQNKFC